MYIIQLCHIKHTKGLLEAKPEFAVIFAIDADTRQIILPKDIFMVNYWRDNRSKQIVMSQGSCLLQGNSLRGIVNWSSAAWSAGQVCQTDLINSFSNNFYLYQLETKIFFVNILGHIWFLMVSIQKIKRLQFGTILFPYKKFVTDKRT